MRAVKNKGNYYCSTEDRATEAQNRHTEGAQKVIVSHVLRP